MCNVSVRTAKLADLPTLLKFQQGVVEAERPFNPAIRQGEVTYYDIPDLITAADSCLYVAEANNQLIGCGYVQIRKAKPYLKHTDYGYLGFMYVLADYRGQGVNRKILDQIKAWCQSRNIKELRLDVYAQNQRAISAYEKADFKPHLVEMSLSL